MIEQLQARPLATLAVLALAVLIYFVSLVPIAGIVYLIYFSLTLPMRRTERARIFLDILELGLKHGQTPEAAIANAASSRDPSLGARFQLLAAHLKSGLTLAAALERVPRILPPEVVAMLKAGERIANVSKVLPACRRLCSDSVSQVRGALNYLALFAFLTMPVAIALPIALNTFVLPKFKAVLVAMTDKPLPPFTQAVFAHGGILFVLQLALVVLAAFIALLTLLYIGGPRLRNWIGLVLPGFPDWILLRLPWRRKRFQRDFSAMLAVLLDADVPEADAVALAAESIGNRILRRHATRTVGLLHDGVTLPSAIRAIDDSGELQWRLSNALKRERGFLDALAGWHEALEARAFQLEQNAAQLATTFLVLVNGALIALIVIAVFTALTQMINEVALW